MTGAGEFAFARTWDETAGAKGRPTVGQLASCTVPAHTPVPVLNTHLSAPPPIVGAVKTTEPRCP